MKMFAAASAAMLAASLASCAADTRNAAPLMARRQPVAVLIGADGGSRGTIMAIQTDGGASFSVQARNMPPGTHGAHLHAVGRCDGPDFTSAGPHWNPTGRQHGMENPAGPHLGDTPSLVVGADGSGAAEFTLPGVSLRTGPNPLLDADGAAFVIHANPDDNRTDPSGNSGPRIACAVLL